MAPDEAEDEPGDDRRAVTRRCALTRELHPVDSLLRFVAGPEGQVVPDIRNRLPGRGIWLANSRALLQEAIRRHIFRKGLKAEVTASAGLPDLVADLLRRDALQMLALANKAGAVTTGFAKVEGAKGPFLALLAATDGSDAEIARLAGLCRGRAPGWTDPPLIRAFAAEELGLSMGRQHVIHAALAVHPAASAFRARAARYVEFLSGAPAKRIEASSSGPSGVLQVPPTSGPGA